jgi:thiol-disulfide isomerase/thioredoxin
MIRFFFLISLFFPSLLISSPFEIVLKGSFPGAEGREIRLMEYGDQISYREMEISSAIVDEKSEFVFRFSKFNPQYVFFRIDHARMGLFVEPGIEYTLVFDAVNFDLLNDKFNPYLNPWFFKFEITQPPSEINTYINKLEDELYSFFSENFSIIHKSRNAAVFQPIINKTDSLFSAIENPFFKDYRRYQLAYYLQISNLARFNEMVNEYLIAQPVLYHNTQYMNFFNTVFDKYIFAGSRKITISDLRHTVNVLGSTHALMDSLGKDTLLRNEVLRELVMVKGLQDMHSNPDYIQANVEKMLLQVAESSKFPQHRIIARNILYEKQRYRSGNPAPSFNLVTNSGVALDFPNDFKGKYLYVVFWASWCESCLLDFIALNEVYTRHKDNLSIIGIATDRTPSSFQNMVNRQNFPWENVYFARDFRLLDAYQVRSLPTYVLIDREGRIISYPASKPSEDFITRLEWLLFQERRPTDRR